MIALFESANTRNSVDVACLIGASALHGNHTVALGILLVVNVVTLVFYGYDKFQARRGGRRIPENILHLLAAVGGTPGAIAGQLLFRHKTRDRKFRFIFFAVAGIQLAVLAAYLWMRFRLTE